MKLTVLSENAVLYPGLEGEFGLSVYLEEGDTRLLFDAGERDACLRNAEKLGIDLRRVTAVAFSHNHRDHCGGFLRLAELLPPDVPIYAHSGFFIRKWWDHRCDPPQQETYSQTLELVGPPMEAFWFFQQGLTGFRCLADDCIQIAPHVYLLGNFPAPPSLLRDGGAGRPPCPGYLPGGAGLCGGYPSRAGGTHRMRPQRHPQHSLHGGTALPGAAHPGRFRRYPPGTPGPGTHCPDGRLFPAQLHHLCRCLSLHRPYGSGSLCPNSARLSAYRRRLGMADALFRKDIRRQKRELTAIRKACKLRNKNPRIPYPPCQGSKVSRGFIYYEIGQFCPAVRFLTGSFPQGRCAAR